VPLVQTNLPMHYKRALILLFAKGSEISSCFYKVPFTIFISRALSEMGLQPSLLHLQITHVRLRGGKEARGRV